MTSRQKVHNQESFRIWHHLHSSSSLLAESQIEALGLVVYKCFSYGTRALGVSRLVDVNSYMLDSLLGIEVGDDNVHDCKPFRICLVLENKKDNLALKKLVVLDDVSDNDINLSECLQQEAFCCSWSFLYSSWAVKVSELPIHWGNSDHNNVSRARLYLIDHYGVQWEYLDMCDCSESHKGFEKWISRLESLRVNDA